MKKIYLNDNNTTIKDKITNAIANKYPMFGIKPKTELHLDDLVFTAYEPVNTKAIQIPFLAWFKNEITDKLRYGLFAKSKEEKAKKNLALMAAMERLRKYAAELKDNEEDDDELFFMGKRIKFYDNFIQVGSEIISLYDYMPYFKKNKKNGITIQFMISLSDELDL